MCRLSLLLMLPLITIPLPITGLTPLANYHIVTQIVGTSSHYYTWQRSNQTSGAATSANGTSWTNQTYGLMYQVYDTSSNGQLLSIFEDNGARWTDFTYNVNGSINQISQYTVAQTSASYLQTVGTLSYTNGLLTGVS